jgi:hypothetical protein
MNANRSRKVRAASRYLKYHHSAEAVAHRCDASVDLAVRRQHVYTRMRSLAKFGGVSPQFRNPGDNAFAIAGHAIAVHVAGKYDETQLRQAPRSPLGMGI